MKPVITFLIVVLFAGFTMAQNPPKQAPPAGHKVVAQDRDKKDKNKDKDRDKDKEKQHHRHHHEHKPGEGKN